MRYFHTSNASKIIKLLIDGAKTTISFSPISFQGGGWSGLYQTNSDVISDAILEKIEKKEVRGVSEVSEEAALELKKNSNRAAFLPGYAASNGRKPRESAPAAEKVEADEVPDSAKDEISLAELPDEDEGGEPDPTVFDATPAPEAVKAQPAKKAAKKAVKKG